MPANPKALAVRKVRGEAKSFEASEKAYRAAVNRRRKVVAECVAKGCTLREIGEIFGVTPQRVSILAGRKKSAA